jgi:geranylgeranyl reductase family protein
MTHKYDVIIAGGGPAGASAAFFLSEAGRRVLVLEKERLPRYKTCGGAVSERVLAQFPFSFEPVIQSRVRAISYALGADVATIPLDDSALCMVMREEFDAYLLDHVRADLRTGDAVTAVEERNDGITVATSRGERIGAHYLIAADGANSVVAHALHLRKQRLLAGAIEIEAVVPAEVQRRFGGTPMLIFGEVGIGYLWIFPKADHLSVGVGGLNPMPGELQAALERVMPRFGISIQGQPRRGHPLPIYHRGGQVGTHRTLLAGDAAGLVDPFTGEGIRFALQSGRIAAEAILRGRPERYTAIVEREIGLNHRLGAALTAPFYGMPRPSFELALRNPQLSRSLASMVDGRIGYGRLILNVLASFPGFVLIGRGLRRRAQYASNGGD